MFVTLLRKEILENRRTHRLLILSVVLLVFGMLSPVVARFTPEIIRMAAGDGADTDVLMQLIADPTVIDAVDQYLKNLTQIGMLVLVLLAMGLVAGEKDRKTAVLLLVRPVRRSDFLMAKFSAFALSLCLCLAASGLLCFLYTGLLFGEWLDAPAFAAINGLMLLYLLVPTTLTFFGSTISRNSVLAACIGLGGWMALNLLGSINPLRDYMPGRLSAAAAGLARGMPFDAWTAVLTSLALIIVCLICAAGIFQKQEL